jgi:ribonucleoside-triphosphate reductase
MKQFFIKMEITIMRSLEVIESDLAAAREALSHAKGLPAEVYSRIVGYYRSVRNWNRGKREEYGERKLFTVPASYAGAIRPEQDAPGVQRTNAVIKQKPSGGKHNGRLMLFVRPACPACPGAKAAAGRLGIPVDLVNADTEDGMAEAVKRQVFSTPTAILLAHDGQELGRALDAGSISTLAAAV